MLTSNLMLETFNAGTYSIVKDWEVQSTIVHLRVSVERHFGTGSI
jgi:hypothetical protein